MTGGEARIETSRRGQLINYPYVILVPEGRNAAYASPRPQPRSTVVQYPK
jgi:hypothetical protein